MSEQIANNIPERTSALESWKSGVDKSIGSIFDKLDHIESLLSANNKTNWGVIFAGMVLALGLWAAAIRPMNNDIDRQEKNAEVLAEAVKVQNVIQADFKAGQVAQDKDLASLKIAVDDIKEHGSPLTSQRISLLEYRMSQAESKK